MLNRQISINEHNKSLIFIEFFIMDLRHMVHHTIYGLTSLVVVGTWNECRGLWWFCFEVLSYLLSLCHRFMLRGNGMSVQYCSWCTYEIWFEIQTTKIKPFFCLYRDNDICFLLLQYLGWWGTFLLSFNSIFRFGYLLNL